MFKFALPTGGMKFVVVLFLIMGVAASQLPIPRRMPGFVYCQGDPGAPVHMDMYIDLLCPDSKAVFPTLLNLTNFYGPSIFTLTAHLFPLPYHHNAFLVAKAAVAIDEMSNKNLTFAWMEAVFAQIEKFSEKATLMMTETHVISKIEKLAENIGVQQSKFRPKFQDRRIEMETRIGWKYACTRGVAATPTIMLNDITVPFDLTWSVDDWKKIIQPLI